MIHLRSRLEKGIVNNEKIDCYYSTCYGADNGIGFLRFQNAGR